MYFVYLILCADNTLYAGVTTDLGRRLKEHQSGKGSRYTRAKKALKILYSEPHSNRSEALKREAEIKSWKRAKKLELTRK